MRIKKGMHGLKQSGIITNQELVKHMAIFVQHTPGLLVHDNRHTIFSLVVNNFCVQYSSTDDSEYFLNTHRSNYFITVDMEVTVYIEIKLEWDYVHRTVKLSMANYVRKAFHTFQHILRCGKEYLPHICAPIQYGKKIQYADPLDAAEYLS